MYLLHNATNKYICALDLVVPIVMIQVPGNIRRAEHFVAFLRRFVLYLKEKLGVNQVETENPPTFLAQLQERLNIDGEAFLT